MASVIGQRMRRGFTLLEMVLAIAVLVAVASLGASLWAQASGASVSAQERDRGLKLQRIGGFLRSQWTQRRVLDPLAADADEVSLPRVEISETGVAFPTALAMLFPEAPLVEARYELRRGIGDGTDLWYIESPITRFGPDPGAELSGRSAAPRRELELLRADSITLERFGPSPQATGTQGEEEAELEAETTEPEAGWFQFGEQAAARSDALRVTVRYAGEEAVWVLVARPSR